MRPTYNITPHVKLPPASFPVSSNPLYKSVTPPMNISVCVRSQTVQLVRIYVISFHVLKVSSTFSPANYYTVLCLRAQARRVRY